MFYLFIEGLNECFPFVQSSVSNKYGADWDEMFLSCRESSHRGYLGMELHVAEGA